MFYIWGPGFLMMWLKITSTYTREFLSLTMNETSKTSPSKVAIYLYVSLGISYTIE